MAPAAFDELLAGAPANVSRLAHLAQFDLAIRFATARTELDRSLELLPSHLCAHGMIRIAWRSGRTGWR